MEDPLGAVMAFAAGIHATHLTDHMKEAAQGLEDRLLAMADIIPAIEQVA